MNLINETYFGCEPILIQGLEQRSNGYSSELTEGRINNVLSAISRFEPLYLKALMGDYAYEDYLETEDDEKWNTLKDKIRDSDKKRSPIANYVFYHYHLENSIQRGDTGDYIPKSNNMDMVTPAYKLSLAWNDMVEQNKVLCQWIYDNIISATLPLVDVDIDPSCWYNNELLEYKSTLTHFV